VTSEPTAPEKPQLTPEERRRRKARRAWIPTFVIAGVIAVAIVVAVVLQLAGAGKLISPPPGNSKFNIAGLRVVNGAADVQIDVRAPLSAKSVGLPANSSRTFGPFNSIALEVDLNGTSGEKRIFVDSMHVVTHNGLVTSISTSTHDYGYLFIRTQLASLNVLGLTTKQMADFENAMPNGAGDAHSHFSLPFGTGNALGVPTAVTVACAGAKGCMVSTKTTLLTK
jgi:hypothetical protein